ncbi:4-oxalocrotonate decarboxylase [Amycolatopsis minnesotensis]|uniref:Fumarylacetoacetate hydrolase family protein n=1 Tax=Amycolatopsis minnesotensis TaxID=337894 RepID=A0ABP5C013_9PSEU
MTGWTVTSAAEALLAAERTATARPSLTGEWAGLDLRTAYAVQDEALRIRVARGERVVGVKLGLTSKAERERMGADRPIVAWLTDAMVLPAGAPLPGAGLIHPRVEPEIAFTLSRALAGPGVTAAAALAAVDTVHAGLEMIDSRFDGYQFTIADAVADNGSSSLFTLGSVAAAPRGLDLALEACLLEVDGSVVDSATGAAVQGHPAEALALAANLLGERGSRLEAGWVVLTGGMTDAVPSAAGGRVAAQFTSLGTVTLDCGRT